ncbi:hypothetical protein [Providencia hangzhouensis]|uniref:hypothetical protein n=1 Tax=Providencia hangzhouensis TaxID=3031799 RepID=UPI0034DDBB4A
MHQKLHTDVVIIVNGRELQDDDELDFDNTDSLYSSVRPAKRRYRRYSESSV